MIRIQPERHEYGRGGKLGHGRQSPLQGLTIGRFPRGTRRQGQVQRGALTVLVSRLIGKAGMKGILGIGVTMDADDQYRRIRVKDGRGSIAGMVIDIENGYTRWWLR